jgi:hypothetical protein
MVTFLGTTLSGIGKSEQAPIRDALAPQALMTTAHPMSGSPSPDSNHPLSVHSIHPARLCRMENAATKRVRNGFCLQDPAGYEPQTGKALI